MYFIYLYNYMNAISNNETYSGTLVSFFGCGAVKKRKLNYTK